VITAAQFNNTSLIFLDFNSKYIRILYIVPYKLIFIVRYPNIIPIIPRENANSSILFKNCSTIGPLFYPQLPWHEYFRITINKFVYYLYSLRIWAIVTKYTSINFIIFIINIINISDIYIFFFQITNKHWFLNYNEYKTENKT
jgi:hypothetical protein